MLKYTRLYITAMQRMNLIICNYLITRIFCKFMSSIRYMLMLKFWIKIIVHLVIRKVQTAIINFLIKYKIMTLIKIMRMKVHSMPISLLSWRRLISPYWILLIKGKKVANHFLLLNYLNFGGKSLILLLFAQNLKSRIMILNLVIYYWQRRKRSMIIKIKKNKKTI